MLCLWISIRTPQTLMEEYKPDRKRVQRADNDAATQQRALDCFLPSKLIREYEHRCCVLAPKSIWKVPDVPYLIAFKPSSLLIQDGSENKKEINVQNIPLRGITTHSGNVPVIYESVFCRTLWLTASILMQEWGKLTHGQICVIIKCSKSARAKIPKDPLLKMYSNAS